MFQVPLSAPPFKRNRISSKRGLPDSIRCATLIPATGYSSAWLECLLREQEVPSSNLGTPKTSRRPRTVNTRFAGVCLSQTKQSLGAFGSLGTGTKTGTGFPGVTHTTPPPVFQHQEQGAQVRSCIQLSKSVIEHRANRDQTGPVLSFW